MRDVWQRQKSEWCRFQLSTLPARVGTKGSSTAKWVTPSQSTRIASGWASIESGSIGGGSSSLAVRADSTAWRNSLVKLSEGSFTQLTVSFLIREVSPNFLKPLLKNSFSTKLQSTGPWEGPIHFNRFVLRAHNCSKLFQRWSWHQQKKSRPLPKATFSFFVFVSDSLSLSFCLFLSLSFLFFFLFSFSSSTRTIYTYYKYYTYYILHVLQVLQVLHILNVLQVPS